MTLSRSSDPVERIIADALDEAGIEYVTEDDPQNTARLDFYLPQAKVFIECKRMASARTQGQLARADDVIVVQGMQAARWLAELIVKD